MKETAVSFLRMTVLLEATSYCLMQSAFTLRTMGRKINIHRFITTLATLLSKTGAAKNNGTGTCVVQRFVSNCQLNLRLVDLATKSQ
jgi:hypothetical protein